MLCFQKLLKITLFVPAPNSLGPNSHIPMPYQCKWIVPQYVVHTKFSAYPFHLETTFGFIFSRYNRWLTPLQDERHTSTYCFALLKDSPPLFK